MIDTMEGFNIYDVEDYFISYKSFKSMDIKRWINDHLESDNIDEQVFAKFLKKKYMKNGKFSPHKDQYYYFKRIRELECYLIRDKIMSPSLEDFADKDVEIKGFKQLLSDIKNIEKSIRKSNNKYDIDSINKSNERLQYRINFITNGENFTFKKYVKMSKYKKTQIYSIFYDKLLDMKCIQYQLKIIGGNA